MSTEVLVYSSDPEATRVELKTINGRVLHVLTPHLLVISLPVGIDVRVLRTVSQPVLQQLDQQERLLAEIWLSRFGSVSDSDQRLARAAARERLSWDIAPPDRPLNQLRVVRHLDSADEVLFSTNTPTSRTFTGSVAVGVVMVSGPPDAPSWTPISGSLKYVSVGSDGRVWGVNANDDIFRRDGNQWTKISGALKQISVGDQNNVWGVNKNDQIFRWNGAAWDRVAGALKHVSVAHDGTVWGVNADDKIFRRSGSAWQSVSGSLKQISVGNASNIWGVNKLDKIFQFNGSGWTAVSGSLEHVSVASDGSVFGVNAEDEIFRRNGTHWTQIPGALGQICVGTATSVWGVNSGNNIFKRRV